jgi:hypothetical protein
MTAFLKVAGSLVLAALVALSIFMLIRTPSSDRMWKDYLARPANVSILEDGGRISFTDVRDWTYTREGTATKGYVSRSYNIHSLLGMRFVVEPFPENPVFGHTLLIFDFADAESIAFSVEAMMEEHEEYSPYAGLVNQFELAYTWGTERDFITRRTVLLGHDLYVYPLSVTPEIAREVFSAFAEGTVELSAQARFYNTFAHNCTNELSRLINERHPGSLPWDWSRIFTGTADEYLFKLGYIAGNSFEQAKDTARLPGTVDE